MLQAVLYFLALNAHRLALGGVAQWIECWLASQTFTSSIPGQGTCLGCRSGPESGACERQPIDISHTSHRYFSPSKK